MSACDISVTSRTHAWYSPCMRSISASASASTSVIKIQNLKFLNFKIQICCGEIHTLKHFYIAAYTSTCSLPLTILITYLIILYSQYQPVHKLNRNTESNIDLDKNLNTWATKYYSFYVKVVISMITTSLRSQGCVCLHGSSGSKSTFITLCICLAIKKTEVTSTKPVFVYMEEKWK